MTDSPGAVPRAIFLSYLDSIQQSKKLYVSALEPLCRQQGLTRNEMDILLFLANNPDYDRAADIVSIRKIAKSHVSLSVGELEKRGLLTREFEEEDRRVAHLRLTAAAEPIVRQGRQAQSRFFSRMFAGLSQRELAQWGSMLEKICRNIEEMED